MFEKQDDNLVAWTTHVWNQNEAMLGNMVASELNVGATTNPD